MTQTTSKWNSHLAKLTHLISNGLENGNITYYDNKLIAKLRTIYDGGIPASILLLCNGMSNGYCYDRALLMSRAFLDEENDVQLVYADIDSLKLKPKLINSNNPRAYEHCFVEKITPDKKHLIYDTSYGLIFSKKIYYSIENPNIRKIVSKQQLINFVNKQNELYTENIEEFKYSVPFILPIIETNCYKDKEIYSEQLKKEIQALKKLINYDAIC